MDAQKMNRQIIAGYLSPYDASDACWQSNDDAEGFPEPKDWAVVAARVVISDLRDRRGIKGGFERIDEELRVEIVNTLADLIREVHRRHG
jgi:hypothetical protein